MEARFELTLEYDGTHFSGWQAQEGVRTVEGCLREALERLSPEGFETQGASRTDRGVHAFGQRVLVELARPRTADELWSALQALTPEDIGVRGCRVPTPEFHPRFAAIEKRYLYRVATGGRPPTFGRELQWWIREELDVAAMNAAAEALIGRHDFAAFRNRSKDEPEDTVREIRAAEWRSSNAEARGDGCGDLFFQVIGSGFLYKMVRNIVGTLVEVGRGQRPGADIGRALASRDRAEAGATAPPEGLYLMEIQYPGEPECTLANLPPRF